MIIYNKTWLNNLYLHQDINHLYKAEAISAEELKAIKTHHPVGFYSPNFFIRIGLFILTVVISFFSAGLFGLMTGFGESSISFFMIFFGVANYVVLEKMVKQKHHYRSGVDDALLWLSGGFILGGLFIFLEKLLGYNFDTLLFIVIYLLAFLIGTVLTIRFADFLMAGATVIALLSFFFHSWLKLPWGLATASFFFMIIAAALYLLAAKFLKDEKFIHYTNCLLVVETIALVVFYAAGNFFVVSLFAADSGYESAEPKGLHIPFGWLFWTWTIAIPFAYIVRGLQKKNTVLLRIGLLLVAATAFTIRSFYTVMPLESVLTLSGAALLLGSYAIIKYLKTPKYGFTYDDLDDAHLMDKLNIESLVIAETFKTQPIQPDTQPGFGGGDFGGGGAGDKF
ncbi:hypothetical protein C3K47_16115 [Solitalea longa]|uniref:DUF2157 domain-containing protein n=1 Tax=Solitalea longa TaxID=2079460 RepID=A0A2S4ZY72_9SPHI|nr:hypothetical protein [Solitalea longa]POY35308.1 hypothetical protein C3K47_16115 [Solitalea longa]